MTPNYKHNCFKCIHLGEFKYNAPGVGPITVDLYCCLSKRERQGMLDTFIARFSSVESDYASTCRSVIETNKWLSRPRTDHSTSTEALCEAYRRYNDTKL